MIVANGSLVTATSYHNSDLYSALSGCGGGTYGVVLSLTARAHPDSRIGGLQLTLVAPSSLADDDTLWGVIGLFHQHVLPRLYDAGAHVQWGVTGAIFYIGETALPDATEDDIRAVYRPFTDFLGIRNLSYQMNVTSFPTFHKHADFYLGSFPYGTFWSAELVGGVMISHDTVTSDTTSAKLISHFRHIITETKFMILCYTASASKDPLTPPNTVHPGWRDMLSYVVIAQQWDYSTPFTVTDEQEHQLTEETMPPLQDLGSGSYMNKASFRNPRWKEEFYGVNWES